MLPTKSDMDTHLNIVTSLLWQVGVLLDVGRGGLPTGHLVVDDLDASKLVETRGE